MGLHLRVYCWLAAEIRIVQHTQKFLQIYKYSQAPLAPAHLIRLLALRLQMLTRFSIVRAQHVFATCYPHRLAGSNTTPYAYAMDTLT